MEELAKLQTEQQKCLLSIPVKTSQVDREEGGG